MMMPKEYLASPKISNMPPYKQVSKLELPRKSCRKNLINERAQKGSCIKELKLMKGQATRILNREIIIQLFINRMEEI